MSNPYANKVFLDSFAKLVKLSEVIIHTNPIAILIESSFLYDRIIKESLPLKFKTKRGDLVSLPARAQQSLFRELERVFELNEAGEVINHEQTSRIRKNEKTITFSSRLLKKIKIIENGKDITLQKYIIKNGFYSACFKDPKYMYFMGICFEDSSGISEVESILDLLVPKNEFLNVTSEKGGVQNHSTNFDADSLFGVIENIHSHDDFIFCDDLGIEWADHITLNKADSCICFIHSKHGEVGTGASKLHDVVGQGIKNLGNMFFAAESCSCGERCKYDTNYILQTVVGTVDAPLPLIYNLFRKTCKKGE